MDQRTGVMEPRVSLITLGVADLARATAFYEALGWTREDIPDGVVAFDLLGQTLGLYPRAELARDMGLDESEMGTGGATLAYNVRWKNDVATVMDAAREAGARILKEPHDVFWGGHIGYFADPDGHVWEVAFNPFSPLREDGAFRWNGWA